MPKNCTIAKTTRIEGRINGRKVNRRNQRLPGKSKCVTNQAPGNPKMIERIALINAWKTENTITFWFHESLIKFEKNEKSKNNFSGNKGLFPEIKLIIGI